MREVSPKIARYAVLCVLIALFLGACVQPVALQPFFDDERVKAITEEEPEPGVTVQFVFNNDGKFEPVLGSPGGSALGTVNNPITVPLSSTVTIEIVNDDVTHDPYSLRWYYGGLVLAAGNGSASYVINTAPVPANAPFDMVGIYQLSVIWTAGPNGRPYHGDIYIKVVP